MSEFDSSPSGRPRRGLPEVPEEDDSPTLVNMPVPRRSALTPSSPSSPLEPLPDPTPRRSALTPGSPVETDEVPPAPRRSAYTPPSPSESEPGQWRAVPRDEEGSPKPPLPVWVKSVAIGVVVLLVVTAAWLGWNLATPPGTTSTPSSSGAWELKLPVQVGDYVVGDPTDQGSSAPTSTDETLLSANYSDGSNKVVLQLYRPETDINAYLTSLGVTESVAVGSSMCGATKDTQLPMCVRVVDETAITVAGRSGQDHETLAALVDQFYAKLSGK